MKKVIRTLLLTMPAFLFAACSADEPSASDQNGPVASDSEVRYLKVSLVNAGGSSGNSSRAVGDNTSDYANGTEAENKIRTIDFYFYDADKNYHSHVPLPLTGAVNPTTPATNPSVYGFYETNVPVNLVQGEKMPTYVLCIVNAVNASYYENRTLMDAQKRILSSIYSPEDGGNKYLAMTNSVYYGRDEVTGLDNQLIMATPFDTNKLLTESDLEDMTADELEDVTIDIYVERYAAKISFAIADNAVEEYDAGNGLTLTFEPEGWGLNSYEKSFYFLKSFRANSDLDPTYATYDELNAILFPGWNKPEHFRSFWGRSPAYYTNSYPLVADDILDAAEYPYNVYYHTFNSPSAEAGTSQYFMETTVRKTALTGEDMPDNYLPLASMPSVVLKGRYKINGEAKTFYTYQKDSNGKPHFYSAEENDIAGLGTIQDRLLSTQTIVLKKQGTSYVPVRTSDIPVGSNIFTVQHPAKDVRHGLKIGGDLVTLQITAVNSGFYFYDSELQEYVEINSPTTVVKANRLLYQNLGGAHAYVNGMAFFTAPIQHWGWYREGNPNFGKSMDDWDWSQMRAGDFGVVRNHVYSIQIDRIAGLGTGVISPDDPLLPTTDKVSYAVKFRVNIQKWATLPVQKWEW